MSALRYRISYGLASPNKSRAHCWPVHPHISTSRRNSLHISKPHASDPTNIDSSVSSTATYYRNHHARSTSPTSIRNAPIVIIEIPASPSFHALTPFSPPAHKRAVAYRRPRAKGSSEEYLLASCRMHQIGKLMHRSSFWVIRRCFVCDASALLCCYGRSFCFCCVLVLLVRSWILDSRGLHVWTGLVCMS